MSKAIKEIRTVSDLRTVLRSDANLKFPTMADVDAWETIEKHAGRTTGERLTEQALRRLEQNPFSPQPKIKPAFPV